MIAQGRDVAQSDVEAARWFRKAADQGHAHAKNKLGLTLT
jgi:TPR repeat protein